MKALQLLIYACFGLILIGGAGTIVGLLVHSHGLALPFMFVLEAGIGLFGATLLLALGLGTYAYFVRGRRSLEYFSRRRGS